jgi:hypothetical protein
MARGLRVYSEASGYVRTTSLPTLFLSYKYLITTLQSTTKMASEEKTTNVTGT